MSVSTTQRLKLRYPNEDDPYQQGSQRIQELAEDVDAWGYGAAGATWTTLVAQANWGAQAGFGLPQWRVQGGFCHLRGAFRRNSGNIAALENMFTVPVPIPPQYTDGASMLLSAVVIATGSGPGALRVVINPRVDGIARVYNPGAAAVNLVLLDGLSYPIT